jgi:hypothetical protein
MEGLMRKLLGAAIIIPLVLLSVSAQAQSRASTKLFFDGTTDQGVEFLFLIDNSTGTPTFDPFFTNFTVSCPDGTTFNYEWFFLNYAIPLVSGTFDINIPGPQVPFDWNGTVSGTRASGVQSQGYASYDVNGVVQDCGTGDIGWRARGVGSGKPAANPTATYTVTMTKDSNGHVTQTIVKH